MFLPHEHFLGYVRAMIHNWDTLALIEASTFREEIVL